MQFVECQSVCSHCVLIKPQSHDLLLSIIKLELFLFYLIFWYYVCFYFLISWQSVLTFSYVFFYFSTHKHMCAKIIFYSIDLNFTSYFFIILFCPWNFYNTHFETDICIHMKCILVEFFYVSLFLNLFVFFFILSLFFHVTCSVISITIHSCCDVIRCVWQLYYWGLSISCLVALDSYLGVKNRFKYHESFPFYMPLILLLLYSHTTLFE